MKLYIVVDISGSMVEDGKQFIVREVLRTIKQYIKFYKYSVELIFLAVGNQTYKVDWNESCDYPEELFKIEKDFSAESLIEFLNSLDIEEWKMFLITDGFWSQESINTFDKFISQKKDNIRFIKVNSFSSTQLKRYSTYEAEDIFSALDGFFESSDIRIGETEEEDNDW